MRTIFSWLCRSLCALPFFFLGACSEKGTESSSEDSKNPNAYTIVVRDSIKFSESDCCNALIPSSEVLGMVDASRAKLVFRDDVNKRMILAEYSAKDSGQVKFLDLNHEVDAYHPDISPDGEWVAFGTTFEGWYHRSTLYVQNLRTGQLLALNNQPAVVPRWRILGQDTVIFFMDNCTLNVYDDWPEYGNYYVRFSDGKFSKPQKIFDNGSFDDVSVDFRFAVSLGQDFIVRKMTMVDGEEKYVDTVWYNGEQICNVSLARDSSLRTSFLDIGGSEGIAFVGQKYYPHTRLLVADSLGKIIQAVPSPEYTAFDHTEWLSQGEFQIATLQNQKKELAHDQIVLVDMKNEEVTEFVSGEDMWHPAFWFEK